MLYISNFDKKELPVYVSIFLLLGVITPSTLAYVSHDSRLATESVQQLQMQMQNYGEVEIWSMSPILGLAPGGRLNKKDGLTRYGNSHVKDKTS